MKKSTMSKKISLRLQPSNKKRKVSTRKSARSQTRKRRSFAALDTVQREPHIVQRRTLSRQTRSSLRSKNPRSRRANPVKTKKPAKFDRSERTLALA